MTTVTVFKSEDGFISGYRARGHAGSGKYGQDIVCAAISVLTQSVGDGILHVVNAKADVSYDEAKGFYELNVHEKQPKELLDQTQILLQTFENAVIAIAQNKQYSAYVRMNYSERRSKHV